LRGVPSVGFARLASHAALRPLRAYYQRSALRSCALIHQTVLAIGPSHLPVNLVLKHTYDYHLFSTPPNLINYRVTTAIGNHAAEYGIGRWQRHVRRRLREGGAWKSVQRHPTRSLYGHFVLSGDWDLGKEAFEPLPALVEMLGEGVPHAQTEEYQRMRKRIRAGDFRFTKGCTTLAELDEYYSELMRIFTDIKINGYRTQRELGGNADDEIRVCIDRHGNPGIMGGGTHRLSMALLLGLQSVPVIVKRVHSRWVQACQDCYGEDVQSAIAQGLNSLLDPPDASLAAGAPPCRR
jgi:hypothetical protein